MSLTVSFSAGSCGRAAAAAAPPDRVAQVAAGRTDREKASLAFLAAIPARRSAAVAREGLPVGFRPRVVLSEAGKELGEVDNHSRALGRLSGKPLLLNDSVQSHSLCPYLCFLFWILLHQLSCLSVWSEDTEYMHTPVLLPGADTSLCSVLQW